MTRVFADSYHKVCDLFYILKSLETTENQENDTKVYIYIKIIKDHRCGCLSLFEECRGQLDGMTRNNTFK